MLPVLLYLLVGWVQVVLLYRGVRKNSDAPLLDDRFKSVFGKVIFCSLFMAFVVLVMGKYSYVMSNVGELILLVVFGLISYGGMAITTKAVHVTEIKKYLIKNKAKS